MTWKSVPTALALAVLTLAVLLATGVRFTNATWRIAFEIVVGVVVCLGLFARWWRRLG